MLVAARDLRQPAQELVLALGGRQVQRRSEPDGRGNGLVDQRVERRGADRLEHRVALVRRRTDVPAWRTSRCETVAITP